jgi:hypothetical protein
MSARGRIACFLVSLALVASVVVSWAASADARPAQNEDEEPFKPDHDTPEEGGECFVLTNVFVAYDPQSRPPEEIPAGTEGQVGTVVSWEDYTADPGWTVDIPDTHYLYCLDDGIYYGMGTVEDATLGDSELGHRVNPNNFPASHTCLVAIHVPRNPDGTSQIVNEVFPPQHPSDLYGNLQTYEEFLDADDVDAEELHDDQMLCSFGGIWRRADFLYLGCDGYTYAGVPRRVTITDRCWGRFPTSNYNITYASGAWNDFDSKIYGFATGLAFDIGKTATALGLWAVGWAYEFDFDDFLGFVDDVGMDYQSKLIEPFGLDRIVFLCLVAWVAITLLKGKTGQALGEVVTSVVLMTFAAVLLANRIGYLESLGNVMDKASADLLVAGNGGDPRESQGDLGSAVKNTQASLHRSLVEQPYDYLQWGRSLDDTGCAEARDHVLGWGLSGSRVVELEEDGPQGEEGDEMTDVRNLMLGWSDGRCRAEADFNDVPSSSRLVGAILTLAVSLVAIGLLGGTALTVVASKFAALLLFSVAPFAALLAGMPAGARRLAWLWVAGTGQVAVTVVGLSAVLSLVGLSLQRILQAMTNISLEERFAIILLLLLVLAGVRRTMVGSLGSSAGRLADNLTNVRLGGGGAGWQGPSGSRGLGLGGMEQMVRSGIGRAAWAAGGAAAVGTRLAWRAGPLTAGRLGRAGGRVIAQRRRETRSWRNIVKARRTGDIMSSQQIKTTYPLGGGGGGTPGPGRGPGPARPGGPTHPPSGPSRQQRPPTAKQRALDAERRGDRHGAMYWQGVHTAEQTYHSGMTRATSQMQQDSLRQQFNTRVQSLGQAYQGGTGKAPPRSTAPWVTPAPVAGGGGRQPIPHTSAANGYGQGSSVLEVTNYPGYGRRFRKDFKTAKRMAGLGGGGRGRGRPWVNPTHANAPSRSSRRR